MLEFKAVEVKEKNSLEAELLAVQVAYPSLLTNFFIFNPSFLILPDMIFNNTPIPFLQNVLNSLLVSMWFLSIYPIKLYKMSNCLLFYTKVFS